MGANLIVHGSDINAFRYAMQDSLTEIKSALGDLPAKQAGEDTAIYQRSVVKKNETGLFTSLKSFVTDSSSEKINRAARGWHR